MWRFQPILCAPPRHLPFRTIQYSKVPNSKSSFSVTRHFSIQNQREYNRHVKSLESTNSSNMIKEFIDDIVDINCQNKYEVRKANLNWKRLQFNLLRLVMPSLHSPLVFMTHGVHVLNQFACFKSKMQNGKKKNRNKKCNEFSYC